MIKYENGAKDIFNQNSNNNIRNQTTTVDVKDIYVGKWIADPKSEVLYDGNRVTEIVITRNGNNLIFEIEKKSLGLKTMGVLDQLNNISLYNGRWIVSLDADNNDRLLLKGELFHRVKGYDRVGVQQSNNISTQQPNTNTPNPIVNKPIDLSSFIGYVVFNNTSYAIKINEIKVYDEQNNIAEAQAKILRYLSMLKRLSQENMRTLSVSDTLELNITLSFFYRNYSTASYLSYFADCDFKISLRSKKSAIEIFKVKSLSNYSLLAKGYSSKIDANRNLIQSDFQQTVGEFIYGNFPVNGEIIEIIETNRKKDEAKSVKINIGFQNGILDGLTLIIADNNSSSSKPDLIVEAVFDNYAICKVLRNSKKIVEEMTAGKKISIKTSIKP
jgi:hypothetical protein